MPAVAENEIAALRRLIAEVEQQRDTALTERTSVRKMLDDDRCLLQSSNGTLVEALANWWRSSTVKSLAPYVHAKRLDHRPAFVVGRRGPFVEFAQAVFSGTDEFKKSEVISTVTNVHESQLPKRKKQAAK